MSDRNACEDTLSSLRRFIQQDPRIAWSDSDEPSTDINAARLRGKYYGAKYIVHRPFLYYALHHFDETHLTTEVMDMYHDFERDFHKFSLQDQPPKGWNKKQRADWLTFQMLMSCRMCIDAAKSSTIAFDGVLRHKRLMVTNIFGTAHA